MSIIINIYGDEGGTVRMDGNYVLPQFQSFFVPELKNGLVVDKITFEVDNRFMVSLFLEDDGEQGRSWGVRLGCNAVDIIYPITSTVYETTTGLGVELDIGGLGFVMTRIVEIISPLGVVSQYFVGDDPDQYTFGYIELVDDSVHEEGGESLAVDCEIPKPRGVMDLGILSWLKPSQSRRNGWGSQFRRPSK